MTVDALAPASSQTDAVGQFLESTLATMKPATTSPAPANNGTVPPVAAAAATPPAPVAPSGDTKAADAVPTVETLQKQMSEFQKSLNDQTKANKKLGKNNIELLEKNRQLAKEVQDMRAKYDGTYTPPAGPSPEQEKALVEFQAREAASRKVAEEKYGAETIQTKIFAEESPYRQLIAEQPWVHQRVVTSDTPILEALDALNEHEVLSTYGKTTTSVLDNVGKSLKDQFWKEWTQQAQGQPATPPGAPVKTLGDARGESATPGEAKPAPVFDLSTFSRHIP